MLRLSPMWTFKRPWRLMSRGNYHRHYVWGYSGYNALFFRTSDKCYKLIYWNALSSVESPTVKTFRSQLELVTFVDSKDWGDTYL